MLLHLMQHGCSAFYFPNRLLEFWPGVHHTLAAASFTLSTTALEASD